VRVQLSSRLLRRGVPAARDALKETAYDGVDLKWYAYRDGVFIPIEPHEANDDVIAVIRRTDAPPPAWQLLCRHVLRIPDFEPELGQSLGAALFARADVTGGRLVVYTFGTGYLMLDPHTVDPRFGLLTVLNRMAATNTEMGSTPRYATSTRWRTWFASQWIGSWQRARPRSLPFFSRIALHDACLRV
jgi:uncharacterized protein (TIGR04141 family)